MQGKALGPGQGGAGGREAGGRLAGRPLVGHAACRAPHQPRRGQVAQLDLRARREQPAQRLAQLKSIDTAALSDATRIDVDVMRTAHEFSVEGFAFPYGDMAFLNGSWSYRNAPYVVAQNTGQVEILRNTRDSAAVNAKLARA